jgi:hypothetical protein
MGDREAFRQVSAAYRRLDKDYTEAQEAIRIRDRRLEAVLRVEETLRNELVKAGRIIAALKGAVIAKHDAWEEESNSYANHVDKLGNALAPCGNAFLDPPDGGRVSQPEQVSRLVADWLGRGIAIADLENDLIRMQQKAE